MDSTRSPEAGENVLIPSAASDSSPRRYIPQFSAATQMLLNRIKNDSPAFGTTMPNAASMVSTSHYEDVRRRVVAGMTTSGTTGMTMQMPTPRPPPAAPLGIPAPSPSANTIPFPPTPAPVKKSGVSAIRMVTAGLTGKGKSKAQPTSFPAGKKPKASTARAGAKRKRGRAHDSDSSSLSSLSDAESDGGGTAAAPLTTTKSGRQVTKPATYNPAAMEGATPGRGRRPHFGKRTPGEALCRRCARLASPDDNPIVFCDGCEGAWHQQCHEPAIVDAVVRDATAKWFCVACAVKRERGVGGQAHKKARTDTSGPPAAGGDEGGRSAAAAGTSWAGRTMGQKRAYFATLPPAELVSLLMQCAELVPDLPIFPADEAATPPRAADGVSSPGGSGPARKINSNGAAGGKKPLTATAANGLAHPSVAGTPFDPDGEDPTGLMEAWPKRGLGLYARLPPEWEDEALGDHNDHEAFSHLVYDGRGNKIIENGVSVLR